MKKDNFNETTNTGDDVMEKQIADNILFWEKLKQQRLNNCEKESLSQASKPTKLFSRLLPKWEKRKAKALAKA